MLDLLLSSAWQHALVTHLTSQPFSSSSSSSAEQAAGRKGGRSAQRKAGHLVLDHAPFEKISASRP